MPRAPEQLHKTKKQEAFQNTRATKEDRQFYLTSQWRRFRDRMLAIQRKKDVQRAHELYQNSEDISFQHYLNWLNSGYPLCFESYKQGRIEIGDTLDHITPIRQGGAKLDKNNVQWLSRHAHAVKSGKEAHDDA